MATLPHIVYLLHAKIDKPKWDKCVDRNNGPVYATSVYLDHMAPGWEALVMGDYEIVMPLTGNRKYGIHYLFQPFLTPHTGIIGEQVNATVMRAFLLAIPEKFRFAEINLNRYDNYFIEGFSLKEKRNYYLPLKHSYATISKRYNQNLVRNLRKAKNSGCYYEQGIPLQKAFQPAIAQLKQYARYRNADMRRFEELIDHLTGKEQAFTAGVYHNDKLVASAIFVTGSGRIHYILAGNTSAGKTVGASHMLLDETIRNHAGQGTILDFAGSDIPSIARFYQSFGALEEKYPFLKMNRLPRLLKWAKK